MRRIIWFCIILCLTFVAACARGSLNNSLPTVPDNPNLASSIQPEMSAPGHSLLGFYNVSIDPFTSEATAAPLRTALWHLNALKFLENPTGGGFISFSAIQISGHKVGLNVIIKHPFEGLDHFSGFDVKGVVIGAADAFDPTEPSRKWAGGPNGLRVLNADGWTRWWNPTEFPFNHTVFSYKDGLYGVPDSVADFDATLCGYKVFAASLNPHQNLSHVLAVPLDHPNGRAVFRSNGIYSRYYELVFPSNGFGGPNMIFNYAIDVCHGFPKGYTPPDYIEVPDGFPADANQLEPFVVDVQIPLNSTYLTAEGCLGGTVELKIRVSDWQALLAGTPIAKQVKKIEVTSPSLFMGSRNPELVSDWTSDQPWATYKISLSGLTPDSVLDQQILVSVISSEGDYQPKITLYSGTAPLTSFYIVRIPVSQLIPVDGSGFGLNPLSPWPKSGGSEYNNNMVDVDDINDPKIIWEIPGISSSSMPVVDPEGRVYLSRPLDIAGIELLIYDAKGYQVAGIEFPDFEPEGDPMLVGCSLLWNDAVGKVMRLYPDGSSEIFFTPVMGIETYAFGLMNIDKIGHGFVHGPVSLQAFNKYGALSWVRYAGGANQTMFIGPPTVASDGTIVVGSITMVGTPEGNFKFSGLNPSNGEIAWTHCPEITSGIAYKTAADPLTGQIYYAITNHIVALNPDGTQRWIFHGNSTYLPDIGISPNGTVFAIECVPGQTGGISRLVALTTNGAIDWDFVWSNPITCGPIVDGEENVYFATDHGEIWSLGPDGSARWMKKLDGKAMYITFGPPHSILVGIRQSLFEVKVVCLTGDDND